MFLIQWLNLRNAIKYIPSLLYYFKLFKGGIVLYSSFGHQSLAQRFAHSRKAMKVVNIRATSNIIHLATCRNIFTFSVSLLLSNMPTSNSQIYRRMREEQDKFLGA